jgi:YHS domain-containing protein
VIRAVLIAILILVLASAFWRVVGGIIDALGGTTKQRQQRAKAQSQAMRLVRDPVCGTHVAPDSAVTKTMKGATYYFCSARCRDEFTLR